MKRKIINFINKIPPSFAITISCIIGLIIVALIYYPLIPKLLNYPPDSINNNFQIVVNFFHYTTQYLAIISIVVIFSLIAIPIVSRRINKVDKLQLSTDDNKELLKIVKLCFYFPYIILLVVLFFPPLLVCLTLILLKQELIFSLKVTFMIFSMTSLIALISYSLSERILKKNLEKINITTKTYGPRLNIEKKMLLQFFPLLIFTIVFSFLIIYSQLVETKGESLFDYYKQKVNTVFETNQITSIEQAKELLTNISLKSNDDSVFIIKDNQEVYYSEYELSDFFIKYAFEYEQKHDGRSYEYYGTPVQGAFVRYSINGIDYLVGIRYNIFDNSVLLSLAPLLLLLFFINLIFIFYFSISLKNDVKVVADSLSKISTNSDNYTNLKLPIVSNDEVSDLTIAFNKIQDMTQAHIEQIKDSQNTLMEKERLASLGQLIGGIAHNLKTPIMSISGASEGLTDLIKELDMSIDDPEVNSKDFHDIAREMYSWVHKTREYTEYMSDVITAVKGQAVNLSTDYDNNYTVSELLKRVNILMKHELKNSLTYLNTSVNVDENLELTGDINSLVQVINNMISNSIQVYDKNPEQNIDLNVNQRDNNLLISIKDYGPGIPKTVLDKLFKEMVTTKGKNGTGLGLYMSYSTIRGHFNGDITVDSSDKGTTFTIIIPLT